MGTSVMDKKKLFGSKKSLTVDTSITDAIASAGVQASSPGVPSTYEAPESCRSTTPTHSTDTSTLGRSRVKEQKKEKRRTPSLDRLSGFFKSLSGSQQNLASNGDGADCERGRATEKAEKEQRKLAKRKSGKLVKQEKKRKRML